MSLITLLIVVVVLLVAIVLFVLGAIGVPSSRFSLQSAGLAFFAGAFLVQG